MELRASVGDATCAPSGWLCRSALPAWQSGRGDAKSPVKVAVLLAHRHSPAAASNLLSLFVHPLGPGIRSCCLPAYPHLVTAATLKLTHPPGPGSRACCLPACLHLVTTSRECSKLPTCQAQEAALLVHQRVHLLDAHAMGLEIGDDGGVDVACST